MIIENLEKKKLDFGKDFEYLAQNPPIWTELDSENYFKRDAKV